MLDEEVIVKHAKNENERLLILNAVVMAVLPALLFGGCSDFAVGTFIALGIVAPINTINYKLTWIDAPAHTIRNYLLALSPFIISTGIAAAGLFNPAVKEIAVGAVPYYFLDELNPAPLVSAASNALSALSPEFVAAAAAACGLSIYFITDSRYIIRRIMFFCAAAATALAVFGFIYEWILYMVDFENMPTLGRNAFSTFPDKTQWSAFAMLWMGASLTNAVYSAQRFRIASFFYSLRFFSLCAATVLYLSVIYCGTPLERLLASLLACFGLLMLAFDTAPTKRNMSRHWTSKYSRTSRNAFLNLTIPFSCYAFAALAILALAAFSAVSSAKNPNERLIADSSNPCAITLGERIALVSDSSELIEMRPIFGWGSASFPNVFAFKQGGDLGSSAWISPSSDLVQKLVEGGLAGLALLLLMPLAFFVRWLARWDFSVSALVMFAACAAVAVLSVADYPFQSIAVQSGFWIILMSAFRWDDADVR